MADAVYVLAIIGFFALCLAYIRGCEHIIGPDEIDASAEDAADLDEGAVPTPVVRVPAERAA